MEEKCPEREEGGREEGKAWRLCGHPHSLLSRLSLPSVLLARSSRTPPFLISFIPPSPLLPLRLLCSLALCVLPFYPQGLCLSQPPCSEARDSPRTATTEPDMCSTRANIASSKAIAPGRDSPAPHALPQRPQAPRRPLPPSLPPGSHAAFIVFIRESLDPFTLLQMRRPRPRSPTSLAAPSPWHRLRQARGAPACWLASRTAP
jgi:hypothetical protein